MVDRCIMCGDIVPESRQVCWQCENSSNDKVLCPQCGAGLELMSSHWYNTCDGHARSTIFHCESCQSDWEKDEEFIAKPVKFTRKFWG